MTRDLLTVGGTGLKGTDVGARMGVVVDEGLPLGVLAIGNLKRDGDRAAACGVSFRNGSGPSSWEGDGAGRVRFGVPCSPSMAEGVVLRCRLGEAGRTRSFLLPPVLLCLEGVLVMLSALPLRANGLEGRSGEDWPNCDGRRTKGLVFSGDSEFVFVGEKPLDVLVGDGVGVVARTVAGDALFWRLKGDWRPESKESGEGRMGVDWTCRSASSDTRVEH